MSHSAPATQETAGYPVFEGRMHYIDGYDPASLWAPHSSLQRTSTWVGMGAILVSLAGFGALIFGLGAASVGSQDAWATYVIIGAVLGFALLIGGFLLVHHGRRNYRQYRAETGRMN
ncbi:hypothetical protein LJU02_01290 [Corynebacterium pseudotuberculosis]|uniref:Uncharacterized protein n=2 Tax=Corynebacterium pseudotuberculosis TaxID=1719 RepID=D9QE19_CORP2|nr:hypothetical protein [Corynebacterium pseudotuberculosis]AER68346.1 Hypothetical protein Cp106_0239 [Corynebacterium pseudotuberculosis 1/06-A]ADK28037.1 hypothetical protein CPFRC_01260 [Corynebacterium pseudotuberculosis FRC41]ADL09742.1 hypothetical protein CPC231_01260 [Corynebacterium pseudotuberculosis C231]ADL20148.1 hypothetical protein CP1002_01260 [Corynebacterium pseudotuberculosis 1002]ADO25537.1 hypothetical protein CPI19_01260 [Corynebacterium pseudotuberculosis I19]